MDCKSHHFLPIFPCSYILVLCPLFSFLGPCAAPIVLVHKLYLQLIKTVYMSERMTGKGYSRDENSTLSSVHYFFKGVPFSNSNPLQYAKSKLLIFRPNLLINVVWANPCTGYCIIVLSCHILKESVC